MQRFCVDLEEREARLRAKEEELKQRDAELREARTQLQQKDTELNTIQLTFEVHTI